MNEPAKHRGAMATLKKAPGHEHGMIRRILFPDARTWQKGLSEHRNF